MSVSSVPGLGCRSPYQKGEGALLHAESSKSISRHAVGSGEEASDNPLIKTQSESVGKMTAPQEEIAAATPRHATKKPLNNDLRLLTFLLPCRSDFATFLQPFKTAAVSLHGGKTLQG